MSRTLPTAIGTAATSATVPKILYFVRLDFDAGSICYNSSLNTLVLGGKTYIGAGNLGSISGVSEAVGVKSSEVTVSLAGVNNALIVALQNEPFLNRPAFIHIAVLGADDSYSATNTLLMFSGKMDSISGKQGEVGSFSVSIRSRLSDWERTRSIKYTDADQQKLYPGDKGMEYIPQISQKKIIWPTAAFFPDPRD